MSSKKLILLAFALLVLILAGGAVYYIRYASEQKALLEKYRETAKRISASTEENMDWLKAGQELEALLERRPPGFSGEEAEAKIQLADVTRVIDRRRSMELLKEVAVNPAYPNASRAAAIDFLVDAYEELNFLGEDFEKQEALIFSGEQFSAMLDDAGGDINLAVRKLNELSIELAPGPIAHYRLARWFAEELYKNPDSPKKEAYINFIDNHITAGDALLAQFEKILKPSRAGYAYGLKARALHIAGRNAEAEEAFKKSQEVLKTEPRTVFQLVHLAQTTIFYSAFLAKEYGEERAEDVRFWLIPIYDYLETIPEPDRRNIVLVSLLLAARDSMEPAYPFGDFDRSDIDRFYEIYPRTRSITESLDLSEYVRGHPLEVELSVK